MNIKTTLTTSLNRLRTLSINHPLGLKWDKNGTMTVFQLGTKFTLSTLFDYCYMPKKNAKAIIFSDSIMELLEVQHYLENEGENSIIVPREWGFDILKPNRSGNPLLVHEVRFYSVKNPLVLWYMKSIPKFRAILKNIS